MFSVNLNLVSYTGVSFGPSVTGVGYFGGDASAQPAGPPGELVVPWQAIQKNPSIFFLLNWRSRITKFEGRGNEISALENWATSDQAVSVKFLTGDGGVGKTRLAANFATIQQERDWAAGFVRFREPKSFQLLKEGTLLIVDYPEENRKGVEECLRYLAGLEQAPRIRVLFLTRQRIEDWQETINDSHAAGLVDMSPIEVGNLDPISSHGLYHSAQEKVAEIFGTVPQPVGVEALTEWVGQAPENRRALFLAAAGVYGALHPDDEFVKYTGREIIEILVERELTRLRNTAEIEGLEDKLVFARLLAMATIAGSLQVRQLEKLVQESEVPIGFPPGVNIEIKLQGAGLLTERAVHALEPDIVAAAFAVTVLSRKPETAPELIWAALADDIESGLKRFGRMAYDAEVVLGMHAWRLSESLAEAVRGREDRSSMIRSAVTAVQLPIGWLNAAIAVWQTLLTGPNEDDERAELLNNLSLHLSAAGDRAGALEASKEAVEISGRLAASNAARYESGFATSLNNLSLDLGAAGDCAGALAAIKEAVEIYGRLAASNAARYEPDLASSLTNLSNHLSAAGDRAGALEASKEAVQIYGRLAASNAARCERDLASSLINLSNHLSAAGDRAGALAAIKEAVALCGRLAASNAARYEPDLANSLNSLSNSLSEAGDRAGALEASKEAVEIYGRLAASNAARYEPDLAMSLSSLSNHLSNEGDLAAAIQAIEEAVEISRCLATSNAARYEPDLASSLNNLSNRLGDAGDCAGALAASKDAVEIYGRLAALNAARYEPDFASSLNNLSLNLSAAGDRAGALEASKEAVEISGRLAASNAARYEPDVASSLNNLSNHLSAAGDRAGALEASKEAVEIYGRLAASNAARYERDLASSLTNLPKHLSEAGDHAGALAASKEAVEIYGRLAASNAARYKPDLAASMGVLGMSLRALDRRSEATEAFLVGVNLIRPYAEQFPGGRFADLLKYLERALEQT